MAFFDFISLKYSELNTQINDFLKDVYSRSSETFTNASPFGQILNVLKEFYQSTILYQKNIVRNIDFETATNTKVLRTYSRIAGHNPTRSISATGTLKLSLKAASSLSSDIRGGGIILSDKTVLKNNTNNYKYAIRVGKSSETFRLTTSSDNTFYVNIVQGSYEEQTFTGTGKKNQSFSVKIDNLSDIDNFDVEVLYNNAAITLKDSMYDMYRLEKSCYVKTGLDGGVDVYFGNGYCGFIPDLGSIITVRYLVTNGTSGNILTATTDDWKFISEVTDISGNYINMNNLFDVIMSDPIQFSSDGEGAVPLKNTIANVSRNFVLSTPQQYVYHLTRLGFFSKINVYNTLNDFNYTNDNVVYLYLIPNISNHYTSSTNYFNIPLDVYYLDNTEQDKIITYLKKLGNVPNGSEITIVQPIISKYVMNVYVRKLSGYTDDSIKSNIISYVSNYLTTLYRDDRISRSDMISTIKLVDGVDSVNVTFYSEKNETYHKSKPTSTDIYGLDPQLGDIVADKQELAIIRGGWSDRNSTYYNETTETSGLGPINIIFVGITD